MAMHVPSVTPKSTPHGAYHGHFLRHVVEMTVAMMVGMASSVPVLVVIFRAMDVRQDEAATRYPEVICLVVAAGMIGAMVVWMRHSGHAWARSGEMSAAMLLPLAPIFGLLWTGVIPGDSACGLYCAAMIPAMLIAMLFRRNEYEGA